MTQRLRILSLVLISMIMTLSAQEVEKQIKFETNKGSFTIKLFNDTPLHRDNMIKLVKEGAYNQLIFHRVIAHFMVQLGGDIKNNQTSVLESRQERYNQRIPAEINYPKHYHKRGAVAAARVGNESNPERLSDPIQFYIVIGQFYLENELDKIPMKEGITMPEEIKNAYMTEGGSPHLDNEYTVFGELIDGWKTIEKIQKSETDASDKPVKEIYIKSATIIN